MDVSVPATTGQRPSDVWFARLLIGSILGTVVVVHAVALFSFTGATGDIERADYYEHGEAFDGELAMRAAAATGLSVTCSASGSCAVTVAHQADLDGEATLTLQRADDASLDRTIAITRGSDGRWTAQAGALKSGWWRVRVATNGSTKRAWNDRIRVRKAP